MENSLSINMQNAEILQSLLEKTYEILDLSSSATKSVICCLEKEFPNLNEKERYQLYYSLEQSSFFLKHSFLGSHILNCYLEISDLGIEEMERKYHGNKNLIPEILLFLKSIKKLEITSQKSHDYFAKGFIAEKMKEMGSKLSEHEIFNLGRYVENLCVIDEYAGGEWAIQSDAQNSSITYEGQRFLQENDPQFDPGTSEPFLFSLSSYFKQFYITFTPKLQNSGSQAWIYRGEDISGNKLAIKVYQTPITSINESLFLEEQRILLKMDHPNIIHIFFLGIFEFGRRWYFYVVEPWITGQSLDKSYHFIKEQEYIDKCRLFSDFVAALGHFNSRLDFHRDLYEGNILFNGKQLILIDPGAPSIEQTFPNNINDYNRKMLKHIFESIFTSTEQNNFTGFWDTYGSIQAMFESVLNPDPLNVRIRNAYLKIQTLIYDIPIYDETPRLNYYDPVIISTIDFLLQYKKEIQEWMDLAIHENPDLWKIAKNHEVTLDNQEQILLTLYFSPTQNKEENHISSAQYILIINRNRVHSSLINANFDSINQSYNYFEIPEMKNRLLFDIAYNINEKYHLGLPILSDIPLFDDWRRKILINLFAGKSLVDEYQTLIGTPVLPKFLNKYRIQLIKTQNLKECYLQMSTRGELYKLYAEKFQWGINQNGEFQSPPDEFPITQLPSQRPLLEKLVPFFSPEAMSGYIQKVMEYYADQNNRHLWLK